MKQSVKKRKTGHVHVSGTLTCTQLHVSRRLRNNGIDADRFVYPCQTERRYLEFSVVLHVVKCKLLTISCGQ